MLRSYNRRYVADNAVSVASMESRSLRYGEMHVPESSSEDTAAVRGINCYIVFTLSQHGHHAHIIVTDDPLFKTPEERFDQLGPIPIEVASGDEAIAHLIVHEMTQWLAQSTNAAYLEKSANPVAVFHDASANHPAITSSVPEQIANCILRQTKVYAKAFSIDPLFVARFCQ